MFHALMGRFQLELFIFISYFSTVVPLNSHFLSCRPFVVNATFSTGLVISTCEWDDGGKIDKIILTEIFPSVHET